MATDESKTNHLTDKEVVPKLALMLIGFGGAAIFAVHVLLLIKSQLYFNILMSVYIIAYSVIVVIVTNNYKSTYSNKDFSLITYSSFYSMFLQLFLIAMSFIIYRKRSTYPYSY